MIACPCSSGQPSAECCDPYLAGDAKPPTAVALMRSRYVAYVRRDADYLVATHQCDNPKRLRAQVEAAFEGVQWLGLKILTSEKGERRDQRGWVTFIATYLRNGVVNEQQERSCFRRYGRNWRYLGEAN